VYACAEEVPVGRRYTHNHCVSTAHFLIVSNSQGIQAVFSSVKVPYPTTSVHVGRKVGRLPELIKYHNDAVRELETVLVGFVIFPLWTGRSIELLAYSYLKGGRIGRKRPTIRIGGFMGCGGRQRDAIDFYTCVFLLTFVILPVETLFLYQ
jgi:hypothetical protein